jgi:L-2-hydroxyglutarate oxidase LhgO
MPHDFIIIGGGIAGLHIGSLLSAVENFRVLVLEENNELGGPRSRDGAGGVPP